MRRKVSRPNASAHHPLRLHAEADRGRRTWACYRAVKRGDLRRYRRWRLRPEEEWPRDRWEQIVRTMIEQVGLDQFCEIIQSVVTKMREDEIVAAQNNAGPTVGGSVA